MTVTGRMPTTETVQGFDDHTEERDNVQLSTHVRFDPRWE
jgi:hypothetical protein